MYMDFDILQNEREAEGELILPLTEFECKNFITTCHVHTADETTIITYSKQIQNSQTKARKQICNPSTTVQFDYELQ